MATAKKNRARPCPAPPMPPVAGGAAGHWASGPGNSWRPIPALKLAEKVPKDKTGLAAAIPTLSSMDGPPDFTDPNGQRWHSGQRLL